MSFEYFSIVYNLSHLGSRTMAAQAFPDIKIVQERITSQNSCTHSNEIENRLAYVAEVSGMYQSGGGFPTGVNEAQCRLFLDEVLLWFSKQLGCTLHLEYAIPGGSSRSGTGLADYVLEGGSATKFIVEGARKETTNWNKMQQCLVYMNRVRDLGCGNPTGIVTDGQTWLFATPTRIDDSGKIIEMSSGCPAMSISSICNGLV